MAAYAIAEGLYQGDFLAEDPYEDWCMLQREHLHNQYLDVAGQLARYYSVQGQYPAAIALCQKILGHDSSFEEAYRCLMECYAGQGQRHLAIRQYYTCVEALDAELDLPPSEETTALYEQIRSGAYPARGE
jgi:DNA-binding SARP family transcriptional activator